MAFLSYYGHVSPSDYSEEVRAHGLTDAQATALEREIVKLRKGDIDLLLKAAVIARGGKVR